MLKSKTLKFHHLYFILFKKEVKPFLVTNLQVYKNNKLIKNKIKIKRIKNILKADIYTNHKIYDNFSNTILNNVKKKYKDVIYHPIVDLNIANEASFITSDLNQEDKTFNSFSIIKNNKGVLSCVNHTKKWFNKIAI